MLFYSGSGIMQIASSIYTANYTFLLFFFSAGQICISGNDNIVLRKRNKLVRRVFIYYNNKIVVFHLKLLLNYYHLPVLHTCLQSNRIIMKPINLTYPYKAKSRIPTLVRLCAISTVVSR